MRAFDGKPGELTELDALVAYLQILGKLTDAAHKPVAAAGGDHGQRICGLVLQIIRTVLSDRALDHHLVYAYWPSNKKQFDKAARSILGDEDKPHRDQPWR